MQVESERPDSDPVFTVVRDARPAVPSTLGHDVFAQLAARARARRKPLVAGVLVASAMLACAVLVLERDRPSSNERHAVAPVIPARADAATVAPRRTDWTNLPALWADLERAHHDSIVNCAPGYRSWMHGPLIEIVVSRQPDGTAQVSYPLPGPGHNAPSPEQLCRSRAIQAIHLPNMPAELSSITLVMSVPPVASSQDSLVGWRDPVQTVHDALDARATALRSCVASTSTMTFVVGTGEAGAQMLVPGYGLRPSIRGWDPDPETACLMRVLASVKLPQLPSFLGEMEFRYQVSK
jgi:hypothetical protein